MRSEGRRGSVGLAVLVVLAGALGSPGSLDAAPAAAAGDALLTGRVTGAGSAALAVARVYVADARTQALLGTAGVGADGEFSVALAASQGEALVLVLVPGPPEAGAFVRVKLPAAAATPLALGVAPLGPDVLAEPGFLDAVLAAGYHAAAIKKEEKMAALARRLANAVFALAPARSDAQETRRIMSPGSPRLLSKSMNYAPPLPASPSTGLGGAGAPAAARHMVAMEASAGDEAEAGLRSQPGVANTEGYAAVDQNPFHRVSDTPLSTFSVDVDTASYANVRRFLTRGQRPPRDAVRLEELVNYFRYDYPEPTDPTLPFAVNTECSACPWDRTHRLVRVGLRGRSVAEAALPPANLVFLLDVSGSMSDENKLPLVKQAFKVLVERLRAEDRVAICVYAGAAGLALPSTPGDQKATILGAIERLQSGGSTAGGAGLALAYNVALANLAADGNNRVILASDGDFNVGASSDAELQRLIEQRRDQGIFLTVLGVGMGNYKDSKMETLADKGNGNYAYLDTLQEAKKVLGQQMAGTLFTIAKDVKLQIEFNPARVLAYRLLGYENRLLRKEDFNDDEKDAGEIGAGHTVTALYELVPVGATFAGGSVDPLKYQAAPVIPAAQASAELMTVKLRYKEPKGTESKLITRPVDDRSTKFDDASADFRWAAVVAQFAELLRDSKFKGDANVDQVLEYARQAVGADAEGWRKEFVGLVERARPLLDRPAGGR